MMVIPASFWFPLCSFRQFVSAKVGAIRTLQGSPDRPKEENCAFTFLHFSAGFALLLLDQILQISRPNINLTKIFQVEREAWF